VCRQIQAIPRYTTHIRAKRSGRARSEGVTAMYTASSKEARYRAMKTVVSSMVALWMRWHLAEGV